MRAPRQWSPRLRGSGGGGGGANQPFYHTLTGADPFGNEDSTFVIQEALDYCHSTGRALFIPSGEYLVTQLVMNPGQHVFGVGCGGYGLDDPASMPETRISLISGTEDHMILGPVGASNVYIEGIHFDGNKNNNDAGDIIHIEDAGTAEEGQWHIRDCFMDAAAGYGVYIGAGRRAVQVSDCTLNYSQTAGVRVNGSDAHIDRCIVGSNLEAGIIVGGTVCNVNDCDIYGNGTLGNSGVGDGINVASTITMVSIIGNRIDQNKRNGILVSGSCSGISIIGNQLHGNSQNTNGNAHGVNVVSTTGAITIANNIMGVDGNVSNKEGYFINLQTGATAQGTGNVMQSGSTVNGFTNNPRSFQQTKAIAKVNEWAPTSAVVQNIDRTDAALGKRTMLTSGTLVLNGGFVIPAGVKVSSASFQSCDVAAVTPTNQWAVLVDARDNSIIVKSADATTAAWGTETVKTFTFTSSYIPDVDTPVYVGLVVVAATPPNLRGTNFDSNVNLAPKFAATANSGLTNPASLTSVGTLNNYNFLAYAYLS